MILFSGILDFHTFIIYFISICAIWILTSFKSTNDSRTISISLMVCTFIAERLLLSILNVEFAMIVGIRLRQVALIIEGCLILRYRVKYVEYGAENYKILRNLERN
jgi:hypothetical protein